MTSRNRCLFIVAMFAASVAGAQTTPDAAPTPAAPTPAAPAGPPPFVFSFTGGPELLTQAVDRIRYPGTGDSGNWGLGIRAGLGAKAVVKIGRIVPMTPFFRVVVGVSYSAFWKSREAPPQPATSGHFAVIGLHAGVENGIALSRVNRVLPYFGLSFDANFIDPGSSEARFDSVAKTRTPAYSVTRAVTGSNWQMRIGLSLTLGAEIALSRAFGLDCSMAYSNVNVLNQASYTPGNLLVDGNLRETSLEHASFRIGMWFGVGRTPR
jgi:hypothetical protein